ncbi:hypothetical protein [Magnetospirillum molischianum]|uniref:Uncharacterized protein n=1 Tax=Magnetospirillum molischianum DSM 120 TaxID=1150626 RepID=H8FRY9_MAGML|nr:hypothetical protein [Magnetospirillum molischianum]CCG41127.1 hypothetical protein PHAMO_250007 [Magnetospirillum molischianum DSM 120]
MLKKAIDIFELKLLRPYFTKRYIHRKIKQTEIDGREAFKASSHLPADEKDDLLRRNDDDIREYREWLTSIEDKELWKKALKVDVDIEGIPIPEPDDYQRAGHWRCGTFGSDILHHEVRRALKGKIRERMPSYLKEREDMMNMYVNKPITIATGLLGVVSAIIALLR